MLLLPSRRVGFEGKDGQLGDSRAQLETLGASALRVLLWRALAQVGGASQFLVSQKLFLLG